MFNHTVQTLLHLNKEQGGIREVMLQNHRALDFVLAVKRRICALIHSHCCNYISNYQVSINHPIHLMEKEIQNRPKDVDIALFSSL